MEDLWPRFFMKAKKERTGKFQFDMLMEMRAARDKGEMDAFVASLLERFPQMFEESSLSVASTSSSSSSVSSASPAERLPVRSAKTLTTGDCFYSSIWLASGEQGIRNQLLRCLGIDAANEMDFIRAFRAKLAAEIRADHLPNDYDLRNRRQKDVFDGLRETFLSDTNTYRIILETSYPTWFSALFKKGIPANKNDFLEKLAKEVRVMTRWVSEIEVRMIEQMLSTCGIDVKKYNHDIPFAAPQQNGRHVLHLHNLGEYHWEYFSFNVPSGYTESAAFKAKVKEEKEAEQKGIAARERSHLQYIEGLKKGTAEIRTTKKKGGASQRTLRTH